MGHQPHQESPVTRVGGEAPRTVTPTASPAAGQDRDTSRGCITEARPGGTGRTAAVITVLAGSVLVAQLRLKLLVVWSQPPEPHEQVRTNRPAPRRTRAGHPPVRRIGQPDRPRPPGRGAVGFSLLPCDIVRPPRAWLARTANVARVTEPARGGHFAPYEQPELHAEELREFFRPYRAAATG